MTSSTTAVRISRPFDLLVAAGPLMSLLLTLPLLQQAAQHDRHSRTTDGAVLDHRTGAGMFVLCGLLAAAPALVTAVLHARSRVGALCMAGGVLALAVLCETVVALALEPWFTF
jgi:hypothetical protein